MPDSVEQHDDIAALIRSMLDAYYVKDSEIGCPFTCHISATDLDRIQKLVDDVIGRNVESEVLQIFRFLHLLVVTQEDVQVELELLYAQICVRGIENDSLPIMQGCYAYFCKMYNLMAIYRCNSESFPSLNYPWRKHCDGNFGYRFGLSGHALNYLQDRIAFLQNHDKDNIFYHILNYLAEIMGLIPWLFGFSGVTWSIYLHSFQTGVIVTCCIVALCLIWAGHEMSLYSKNTKMAFRRFSSFDCIGRLLFIAFSPLSVLWLNMADWNRLLVLLCVDVAYLFVSYGVFELFRRSVAKKRFAMCELIPMFGMKSMCPLPRWLSFFMPCSCWRKSGTVGCNLQGCGLLPYTVLGVHRCSLLKDNEDQ